MEYCFACGKVLKPGNEHRIDARDTQKPFVGSTCYAKIRKAGSKGYQPPKGGPRLFLIFGPIHLRRTNLRNYCGALSSNLDVPWKNKSTFKGPNRCSECIRVKKALKKLMAS